MCSEKSIYASSSPLLAVHSFRSPHKRGLVVNKAKGLTEPRTPVVDRAVPFIGHALNLEHPSSQLSSRGFAAAAPM